MRPRSHAVCSPTKSLPYLPERHCVALQRIGASGCDGYHWRVRVDEKVGGSSKGPQFSWWDIQDENAKLPVREASVAELARAFAVPSGSSSSPSGGASGDMAEDMAKVASGAIRSLGKAMNKVAAATADMNGGQGDRGPRLASIAFKLVDLGRVRQKQEDGAPPSPGAPRRASPQRAAAARPRQPQQRQQQPQRRPAPAPAAQRAAATAQPTRAAAPPRRQAPAGQQPAADLMGFGGGGGAPAPHRPTTGTVGGESRTQKLKREYAAKQQNTNRVWDDIDQRWVEAGSKAGHAPEAATGGGGGPVKKKEMGIRLDPNNARGKSANVQAAVGARVEDMRQQQAKAVQEVREREAKKKQAENEEDTVRLKFESKIKVWSEEYGKKKQLRALLSTLHTILWDGAKWKPITIADVMTAPKCKKFYHKATLVVHPDKTHHLNAEQRFLAKRIFDALSQAKTQFDEQG